jgi:hypothetical protein
MAKRKLSLPPLHNAVQDTVAPDGKKRASRPWNMWFDDLQRRMNEGANKVTDFTENNILVVDADGDPLDGGKALPTGDIVGRTDTQTLTNKTLTAPTMTTPKITGVPVHADNAAALLAGLVAGQLYRATGTDYLCVVH